MYDEASTFFAGNLLRRVIYAIIASDITLIGVKSHMRLGRQRLTRAKKKQAASCMYKDTLLRRLSSAVIVISAAYILLTGPIYQRSSDGRRKFSLIIAAIYMLKLFIFLTKGKKTH